MSLLPFLAITGLGAVLALLVRGRERLASAIGIICLVAAVAAAAAIDAGQVLIIDESGLATTDYLRLFLLLGSMSGLVLAIVGAAAGSRRDTGAVMLAILATSALALAVPDARLAVLAATAGGIVGALLTITSVGGRMGATIGMRVLRNSAVAGTMAIAATAWIGRDLSELAAQPVVFGLAYLAMALAVALRFGAIPLHTWAARLTDSVPEANLPLVTAWAPAAFAVVALAWADRSVAPLLVDVDTARIVVLSIGMASILLASLAAYIQDDIEHIVGYSIIGDAGVVILAVAVLDPAAWAPARTFIIAFVVARSAFAAWAAAARATFGTGRVDDLRGWIVRSPLLGVALGSIVLATIGLPGLAAFEARATLVDLAIDGPLAVVVLLGTLSPLVYYGRLITVGLASPEDGRRGIVAGTRVIVGPLDMTAVRAWLGTTWHANRAFTATVGAFVLGALAVGASAGAFGGPAAAAGLPPSLEQVTESFAPEPGQSVEPGLEPTAGPDLTPSAEPAATPVPSTPSFEPIPTS